ncbi:hypothetical protein [Mycobacterium colombiense]|uniref:hypothetical protein n=1 Tax=Mycobacterium colombiense TaxID=339268 RepID=UPI001F0BA05A|nr:hypothetical protein [Mycobacterium colombiense]
MRGSWTAAARHTPATAFSAAANDGIQVMLANRTRRLGIANIEPVCLRPTTGVSTIALRIENLLRGSHHLIERVAAGICGIGVAARLDSLYFR